MWSLAFSFLKKMIHKQKVTETEKIIKWPRVHNQMIECSIISMGVMSYTKIMASFKGNAQTSTNRAINLFIFYSSNIMICTSHYSHIVQQFVLQ